MRKLLILLLLVLILTACSPKQKLNVPNIEYDGEMLTYSVLIEKPTPCYTIEKRQVVMIHDQIDVLIELNLTQSKESCAQVITEEIVKGKMLLNYYPKIFIVKLDGEIISSLENS